MKKNKAIIHIKTSFNNTLITFTKRTKDKNEQILFYSSGGKIGLKGSHQGTNFAAQLIIESLLKKIKKHSIYEIDIYYKGIGKGYKNIINTLKKTKLKIRLVHNKKILSHNGCRIRKKKRL